MKTIKIYNCLRCLCVGCVTVLMAAFTLTSCNNEGEVVPLTKENSSMKTYKVPDPVLLSSDEQSEVQAIRDEYREATN